MTERFRPCEYVASIFDIDYEALKDKGIKALFFDIDNTLMPFDEDTIPAEVLVLFSALKDLGFQLYILSNGRKERVDRITKQLGIEGISRAAKPLLFGFWSLRKKAGVKNNEIAVLGDQMFTDVFCGNRAGAYSILTKPISLIHDEKGTIPRRKPEQKLLSKMGLTPKTIEKKSQKQEKRTIILIGFMGAGKTSVGKILAKKLDLPFIDLDAHIEKVENKSIPQIFEEQGEAYFRQRESEELGQLLDHPSAMVLALGGGTPIAPENQKILKETDAMIIYLQAESKELYQRLNNDQEHPLLQGTEGEARFQKIRSMLENREPVYLETATAVISSDPKGPEFTAERVLSLLEE